MTKQRRFGDSLKMILALPEGREVFEFLFRATGVVASSSYSQNWQEMNYNEGRRSVGLDFWREIGALDPKYLQLIISKIIEEDMNYAGNGNNAGNYAGNNAGNNAGGYAGYSAGGYAGE
jgi:hypothetical protein